MTNRERLEKMNIYDWLIMLSHAECVIALLERRAYTDFAILQRCHCSATCDDCITKYLSEESRNDI